MEIKVAIPRLEGGIFHQKVGIFTDERGDSIAFGLGAGPNAGL